MLAAHRRCGCMAPGLVLLAKDMHAGYRTVTALLAAKAYRELHEPGCAYKPPTIYEHLSGAFHTPLLQLFQQSRARALAY